MRRYSRLVARTTGVLSAKTLVMPEAGYPPIDAWLGPGAWPSGLAMWASYGRGEIGAEAHAESVVTRWPMFLPVTVFATC